MIKLLTRYLNGEVLRSHLAALGILVSLFSIFALITELEDVGTGTYAISHALAVVALTAPSLMIDLAPFAVMLGAVYGLSQFSKHSELIAIRAAGFSPVWITLISLGATVLFLVALVGLESIARPLAKDAVMLRSSQIEPDGELLSRSGYWYRNEKQVVNIASLKLGSWPQGIRVLEFDGTSLTRLIAADTATELSNGQWLLENAIISELPKEGDLKLGKPEQMEWQAPWSNQTQFYELPLISRSIGELQSIAEKSDEYTASTLQQAELWKRLTLPLACVAFALIGAPIGLSHNVRGTAGMRLSLGVLLMLVLYVGVQIATNSALLAGIPAPAAVLTPYLVLVCFALVILWRLR